MKAAGEVPRAQTNDGHSHRLQLKLLPSNCLSKMKQLLQAAAFKLESSFKICSLQTSFIPFFLIGEPRSKLGH